MSTVPPVDEVWRTETQPKLVAFVERVRQAMFEQQPLEKDDVEALHRVLRPRA